MSSVLEAEMSTDLNLGQSSHSSQDWTGEWLTLSPTGRHVSYQRAKRNTNPDTSLLQLEGVGSSEAAQ